MIRNDLSRLLPTVNRLGVSTGVKNIVGKVFGVVLNENTPNADAFELAGGWSGLGTVFYIEYDESKNVTDVELGSLQMARPLFPNQKHYPLLGELIVILDLPSNITQDINNTSEKYYITSINIWNNVHHNSQPGTNDFVLGKTFKEKTSINTLQPFEGDYILESRSGSGLRFGSTSKDPNVSNFWSNVGTEGDPITILTNNYAFDPKSTLPYLENINKDGSSIILSSSQTIPLRVDKTTLNVLTKPIEVDKYNNAQIILNSDRVVIGSKRDEVFLVAKTNIEANANIINLNAKDRTHIASNKIFLGSKSDKTLPDEPLLLGDKTVDLVNELLKELINFCSVASNTVSTPQGTPIMELNAAASLLSTKLETLLDKTESIKSTQSYTA